MSFFVWVQLYTKKGLTEEDVRRSSPEHFALNIVQEYSLILAIGDPIVQRNVMQSIFEGIGADHCFRAFDNALRWSRSMTGDRLLECIKLLVVQMSLFSSSPLSPSMLPAIAVAFQKQKSRIDYIAIHGASPTVAYITAVLMRQERISGHDNAAF